MADAASSSEPELQIVAKREGWGRTDSWEEYLCLLQYEDGWQVGVYRHEVLDEIPEDWFDEDWEPKPPHADAEGNLLLPETLHGVRVTGYSLGYFLGELLPIDDDNLVVCRRSDPEEVAVALRAVGWAEGDTPEVVEAMQKCQRRTFPA